MVDEQIATAWEKLTTQSVYESVDPLSPKSSPRMRWFIRDYMGRYVPDPAVSPWEWVKAFTAAGCEVRFGPPPKPPVEIRWPNRGKPVSVAWGFINGDDLEAVIRAWARSVVRSFRTTQ